MRYVRRRWRLLLGGSAVIAAAGTALLVVLMAPIGTGLAAKYVCSGVFLSGRSMEEVVAQDLRAYGNPLLDRVTVSLERERGVASASFFGYARREAVVRRGLGCTLAIGTSAEALRATTPETEAVAALADGKPWPESEGGAEPVLPPSAALARLLDDAFAEPEASTRRRTRAIVIVHEGRIIAERYAGGYGPSTLMPGWSTTKSVVNALVGVLVADGGADLDAPLRDNPWWAPEDPRSALTLRHLLHMSSGLEFSENYANPFADVMHMLFTAPAAGAYAAQRPLAAAPGGRWAYAGGTTNLITTAMRGLFASEAEYLEFPRRRLFDPIGMRSAVMETDAANRFVGSSLMFATARDWARFGMLFADGGAWNGRRILPQRWVRFSATPAPAAERGQYGAHWWLKLRKAGAQEGPGLPADAMHATGHAGQFISVIPSIKLVVVRLGLTLDRGACDQETFVGGVIEALRAQG